MRAGQIVKTEAAAAQNQSSLNSNRCLNNFPVDVLSGGGYPSSTTGELRARLYQWPTRSKSIQMMSSRHIASSGPRGLR